MPRLEAGVDGYVRTFMMTIACDTRGAMKTRHRSRRDTIIQRQNSWFNLIGPTHMSGLGAHAQCGSTVIFFDKFSKSFTAVAGIGCFNHRR